MALTVEITGGENIDQGDQVTLTATVTDADGNTPPGTLQYAWSASRGSFVGNTNEATAVYHADFTDTNAVDVTITCNVTRPANAAPTSSGPSLTALAEIGVTGVLVNMFMTALGAVATNTNNVLYNASTGTLDAGSDQRLSSNVNIFQLRWDNQTGFNHFVLNNNEGGNIGDFFRNNNNQSVYIIFADGTYKELTPTDFANANSAGQTWARWEVTDAAILALLNGLSATSDLVVGVADTGSIGWDADTGSDTETFTAAVAVPLTIEAIDEQFIPIGTTDYDLVIDIGGAPDSVEPTGDFEGFYHDWDAAKSQLHIKSADVTRLIAGAVWTIKLTKRSRTLTRTVTYNVVPNAPIIMDPGAQTLYKGGNFNLNVDIANRPAVARGSGLLTALKYVALETGVNTAGRLPVDANLTENTFMSRYYAENDGGSDDMMVPVTIKTHTGVYIFDAIADDLLKIGPDAATLHWTYEAPNPGSVRPPATRYDRIVASPDGIYLFSDRSDDLLKVSPDGALLWTFSDAITGNYDEMIVTDSGVYMPRRASTYKVHPATGELLWETDIRYNTTIGSFQVYAGDVYVLSVNTLTKLNGEDGTVAWTYEAPSSTFIRAIAGDGVYLRTGQTLRKINIATGMLAWTQTYSGFSLNVSANNDYLILSIATRRNQGSPTGPYNVLRINPSNGATLWTHSSEIGRSRFLDSDGFYLYEIFSTRRRVMKVNLNNGTQAWLATLPNNSVGPIIQPNGMYIRNSFSNTLIKLNKSNGTQDWSLNVNMLRDTRWLIEDGSDIYAIAPHGTGSDLVKLNVSDGSEQWRYESTTADYRSLALPDFGLGD